MKKIQHLSEKELLNLLENQYKILTLLLKERKHFETTLTKSDIETIINDALDTINFIKKILNYE